MTSRQGSTKGGAVVKSSSYPRGGTKAYSSSTYVGASAAPGRGGAGIGGASTKVSGPFKGGNTGKSNTTKGGTSNLGGATATGGRARGSSSQGGSSLRVGTSSQGGTPTEGGSLSTGGAIGGSPMVGIAGASWVAVGAPMNGVAGAPAEWQDVTIYVARDLTPTDATCTSATSQWLDHLSAKLFSARQCTVDNDCASPMKLSTACGVICPLPISQAALSSFKQEVYDFAQSACFSCPRFSTPQCVNSAPPTSCVGGLCRLGI